MMDCLMLPIDIAEPLPMTTWGQGNIYSKLFTIPALTNPKKQCRYTIKLTLVINVTNMVGLNVYLLAIDRKLENILVRTFFVFHFNKVVNIAFSFS